MAIGTTVSNEAFLWVIMIILNYMLVMNYGKAFGWRRLIGASLMAAMMPISFLVIDLNISQSSDLNVIGLAFTIMGIIYWFIQLRIFLKEEFGI